MELEPYVLDLQRHLAVAADAGGDASRDVAERLTAPLEAATRLVLLEALSAAASEITRELAPGSVDVRLRGRDPEFVVTTAEQPDWAEIASAAPAASAPDDIDDTATSRTTLRLPDQLKSRVDEAAAAEGVSVNAWLVRAVASALEAPRPRQSTAREIRGDQFTGWAR
jgi:predicted transcriptional regulator